MVFPLRRSPRPAPSETAAALPPTFALVRIIGNDLPPRHEPGQALRNLRFILENEPALEGCCKRWIVNRIADPHVEHAVVAALDEYRKAYVRIEFRNEEFARLDAELIPRPARSITLEAELRLKLRSERTRINYAIPVNRARNIALREVAADWIMPFDGNCFISSTSWAEIRAHISAHPAWRYIVVPMARAANEQETRNPAFRPEADGEPQIMFRREAPLTFDEAYPYGRRDKVELLWRLGVAGPWDRWRDEPWDLPRSRRSANNGEVGRAGWVIRLTSGRNELERGRKSDAARSAAREVAILRFLASLDHRVASQPIGTT
jgi:hypothetical protein